MESYLISRRNFVKESAPANSILYRLFSKLKRVMNLVVVLKIQFSCNGVVSSRLLTQNWKLFVSLTFLCTAVYVLSSILTLCDPIDFSAPGHSVHGIFQASILEWVAISCSRQSLQPRDWICISCVSYIGGLPVLWY